MHAQELSLAGGQAGRQVSWATSLHLFPSQRQEADLAMAIALSLQLEEEKEKQATAEAVAFSQP